MKSMLVLCAAVSIFASVSATGAIVDRLTAKDQEERLTFIRKGLAGQLHSPAQRAQFRLLLCQPKAAWKAAEQIQDERTKALFKGTILVLVSTPRPAESELPSERSKNTIPRDRVAAEFNLDQEEIWADEVGDLAVSPDCDFPIGMNRAALSAKAKELMERSLADEPHAEFSLYALASDVGLQPAVGAEMLKTFSEQHGNSSYFPRLKFFEEQLSSGRGSESTSITIKGNKAWASSLSLTDASFHSHRLEIPWLLRQ